MEIGENVPLAPFSTFHIGGPARYFARVESVADLKKALDLPAGKAGFARDKHLPTLILGGGSNTLFADEGFDGLVIKIEIKGIEVEEQNKEEVLLIAGAGESWDDLVARAVDEKLWGLENLSGIPGTVGGAVVGNIGAYGAALSQTLTWAEIFDRESGEVTKINNAECAFGYRDSFFKKNSEKYIVLRAAFILSRSSKPDLSYKDLALRFGSEENTEISFIRKAVLEIREGKFPDLSREGTAGSFFKNPILPRVEADQLRRRFPDMPLFSMPEAEGVKVPLAWLLDHALSMKGLQMGRVRLFEKQPLVIVAENNCTAREVRDLAEHVSKKVFETFGIELEPEVKIIL